MDETYLTLIAFLEELNHDGGADGWATSILFATDCSTEEVARDYLETGEIGTGGIHKEPTGGRKD